MKNYALLFVGIAASALSCGQNHRYGDKSAPSLTCLVLGYDSIIYYSGSSRQMQDIHQGKITDTLFVNAMFEKIKREDLTMILKPGGGADMLGNFQDLVNLANTNGVQRREVDSGDSYEDKAFGFVTAPMIKASMRGEDPPALKLDLPREALDTGKLLPGFPKASQLVVLISSSNDIYAYWGADMRKGRKYTYQALTDLLKERVADSSFSVAIKPSKDATYKNTVDMLDVMTSAKLKHYALVDISKAEEDYLHQVYP